MGKAQILTAKGQGLYRVQVLADTARAEAEIAQKTARLAEIAARQSELTAATNEAYLAWTYAKQVLDAKIYAYQQAQTDGETRIAAKRAELAEATEEAQADDPDTTADESEITSLEQAELDELQAQLDALIDEVRNAEQALKQAQHKEREAFVRHQALRAEAARLTLEKAAAQKRIGYLQEQTAPADPVDAWCADYNETLSGDVGTIEVGRRAAAAPILRPGGASGDQAGHDPQRDGQTQAIAAATPAAAFWNAALRPGFDRWRPRYRLGEITALDAAQGVADVALDAAVSSHQSLDINQTDVLADVPIQYLDCHAQAFELGDRVVVEFQGGDWDSPRIIGFEREPRECYIPAIACDVDGAVRRLVRKGDTWSEAVLGGAADYTGIAAEIFAATNSERAALDLKPFVLPPPWTQNKAQSHAENMAATGIYAHESAGLPEGEQTIAERLAQIPYVEAYGENLAKIPKAAGWGGAEIVAHWKASPGHWANIIGFNAPPQPGNTALLLGVAADDDPEGYIYYVQVMVVIRPPRMYGNIDWRGEGRELLSWYGVPGRYFEHEISLRPASVRHLEPGLVFRFDDFAPYPYMVTNVLQPLPEGWTLATAIAADGDPDNYIEYQLLFGGAVLFRRGAVLLSDFGARIAGAAIAAGKIVYITSAGQGVITQEAVRFADLAGNTAENQRIAGTLDWPGAADAAQRNVTPWFFNRSGTEATAVRNVNGAYRRYRLLVDPDAETFEVVDLGPAGGTRREQVCTYQTTGSYAPGDDGEKTGLAQRTQTVTEWAEIADYDGDTEVVARLEVEQVEERSISRSHQPLEGQDAVLEEVSYARVRSARITRAGADLFHAALQSEAYELSCAEHWDGTSPVASSWDHAAWLSGSLAVHLLDLRTGALQLSVTASQAPAVSGDEATLTGVSWHGAVDDATTTTRHGTLQVPGHSAERSDITAVTPRTAVSALGPIDLGGWSAHDLPYYGKTETVIGPLSELLRLFGGSLAVLAQTAGPIAYLPGDTNKLLVSVPAIQGLDSAVIFQLWQAEGRPVITHLTGGNAVALTAATAPYLLTPIGAA